MTKLSRDGREVSLRFEADEIAALRDLGGQIAEVLDGGVPEHGADPVRDRLFPRAYLDPTEDRAESEFQSVVHEDLVRAKADAVAGFLAGLDAAADGRGRVTVSLDPAAVEQWVGALNDVRLAIGVAIGVTESDDDSYDARDPRAPGLATYHWLTWLQGSLVEVLLEEW
ncbi:MAG: DUF2017 family protein [Acidimicrobiia bacterium]